MVLPILILFVSAAQPVVYAQGVGVSASSDSGAKYAPIMAVDGSSATRWASANHAPLPQWLEIGLGDSVPVDTVILRIPVGHLYSDWKDLELTFADGESVRHSLEPGATYAHIRFEPRRTDRVRIAVPSVHNERNYIGIYEAVVAHDPDGTLGATLRPAEPLQPSEIEVRGRAGHPCVNITPEDVRRALERVEKYEWARKQYDEILAKADTWLRESDGYWLEFLPEPGACYAYGFTGDPITGGGFGTWANARCSWDHPRKVMNPDGHLLPDDEHPDDGTGYMGPDGRIHYFIGIWNAWVTEQWTLFALPALSNAYLLTGDERYAERGTLLLDALASVYSESTSGSWDYPSDPPSGRFARPWYQVARTLVYYVDQYDALYNSPSMDKTSLRPGFTRRENIEKRLLLDGAYYCYSHSFHGALHNGHADYMRGALAVGCVLDVPEYVRNALESPYSILTMLANNIDRDGRYYETSLGYAIHARNLYLTFADPLLNLRSREYPEGVNLYDDPRMQSCLLLPDIQVELAGRRPNFGDCGPDHVYKPFPTRSFSEVDYRYLERLYAMVSEPAKRAEYGAALLHLANGDVDRQRDALGGDWLLWHAADPPVGNRMLPSEVSARVTGSWVAGMKGMALLRSGRQAALLRFGPSLNHGDPDDLALLYYANGYELSYDIGYGLGSTHVQCGWASSTVSHCLVTVDESNQSRADGTGGSLMFFGDLPSAKVVEATSELSYAAQGVSEYRRTLALLAAGYLVDVFRVAGGRQHDYGFGSIGTDLRPFGVAELKERPGSLAEGVAWGEKIGNDGDIVGYPNKPYWRPPPENGYGFFFNVQCGVPQPAWGGTWSISGTVPTRLRIHVLEADCEALFASAPGLYPDRPLASYVLARRRADADEPLVTTFLAVYEPFSSIAPSYAFDHRALAERLVERTVETKVLDSLAILILKGRETGDSMTFRLGLDKNAGAAGHSLVIHCLKAPSYGVLIAEWDGKPIGQPTDLCADGIDGPVALDMGPVDVSPGEHTLTIRAGEGAAHYLGVAGVSFGAPAASDAQPRARIESARRLAGAAAEVRRADGAVDLIMAGPCRAATAYGQVDFDGDFALLVGDGRHPVRAELLGCASMTVSGSTISAGPPAFEATITGVDHERRAVVLDTAVPDDLRGLVAVFSNPAYSRTTAYHVLGSDDSTLCLQASTFVLGAGRVQSTMPPNVVISDVTHEYAKSAHFFDGKQLVGEFGGSTRVVALSPGSTLTIAVEDPSALRVGERFEYIDLSVGDRVRIALPKCLDL